MKIKIKDPIIKKVVKKFVNRSKVGFKKYRVTLQDDPGNMDNWLNHLQEELMDAVNYIERAREEIHRDKLELLRLKGEKEARQSQLIWWYEGDVIKWADTSPVIPWIVTCDGDTIQNSYKIDALGNVTVKPEDEE